ncbi:hypothetical protein QJS10_CPB04g01559 [Acorus calamus]|uniref:Uncharacterized protein n=1 Tax=Acorus calamus TaxID=4465 RepID=A0AAV9EXA3_ACOCL|nr:hypothetical protein QJS10_CPB04g01559 [Acorus calamus]
MSKPWGGAGAWAADAELAEEEEKERAAAAPPQSFPSLREAVAAKPKKKKMTLSEFTTGTYVGPGGGRGGGAAKGLTTDEMIRLPTGPKERTAEELEQGRLGGGFRSYGSSGGGGSMRRREEGGEGGGGRRSYGGGFDDDRRGPPSSKGDFEPSRADEVDNWAAGKKTLSHPSRDSSDRYSSLGGSSRADEVDSWGSGKKPMPVRSSGFGSGFRDSTRGMDSDRWTWGAGLPSRDGDTRERPRLVLDRPKGDVGAVAGEVMKPASTRPSPFGAARPREEVLAEKGVDWRKVDSEVETKVTSRPTSAHSSRPSSAHSNRGESPAPAVGAAEEVPRARPRVNPFGDAKPREVLLQEKGKDWRKMDLELEHRAVGRPETEEEKKLKEEIDVLKKALADESDVESNGQLTADAMRQVIDVKEKDLEQLVIELDKKVRLGQRSTERPSSGAGRGAGYFPERPPSQSGPSEDYRNVEFMDRPRSHGAGDAWGKPVDDRRGFGARERGFLGNRDFDRSRSRDRW